MKVVEFLHTIVSNGFIAIWRLPTPAPKCIETGQGRPKRVAGVAVAAQDAVRNRPARYQELGARKLTSSRI